MLFSLRRIGQTKTFTVLHGEGLALCGRNRPFGVLTISASRFLGTLLPFGECYSIKRYQNPFGSKELHFWNSLFFMRKPLTRVRRKGLGIDSRLNLMGSTPIFHRSYRVRFT